jgi:hypothetical protein
LSILLDTFNARKETDVWTRSALKLQGRERSGGVVLSVLLGTLDLDIAELKYNADCCTSWPGMLNSY